MAETPLGAAVDFLQDFGFFDIVLPFLLVFTVVFGILEKTKIFGTEGAGETKTSRKNINSMVAFVVAFFVISTKEIVQSLKVSLPQVSLILVFLISFMLLAGSFFTSEKEFSFAERKGWKVFLTLTLFVSLLGIFFNAIGWLDPILDYFLSGSNSTLSSVFILLAIIVLVVVFIVKEGKEESPSGG